MVFILSQMERVKRLVPDHSANDWYPLDGKRKKSVIFFSDLSQMSVGGVKVNKDPQKSK